VVANSGLLGAQDALYDALPTPPAYADDGGYMALPALNADGAGVYNTLPLPGQTQWGCENFCGFFGQNENEIQEHQMTCTVKGDPRQLRNTTYGNTNPGAAGDGAGQYDSLPLPGSGGGAGGGQPDDGEYMTVTNGDDIADDDDDAMLDGGEQLARAVENPQYHAADSGVPLYDTLSGELGAAGAGAGAGAGGGAGAGAGAGAAGHSINDGDYGNGANGAGVDVGQQEYDPRTDTWQDRQDGPQEKKVGARFSAHRSCVQCYSSKRGALGVCISSFIVGTIMLIVVALAVINGSIAIDTGWSSFEIKSLLVVRQQRADATSKGKGQGNGVQATRYGNTFTPWCVAGSRSRMRRADEDGEELNLEGEFEFKVTEEEEQQEQERYSQYISKQSNASSSSSSYFDDDGCADGGVALSTPPPWWSNMAPWFKTAPEAAHRASCSSSISSGSMKSSINIKSININSVNSFTNFNSTVVDDNDANTGDADSATSRHRSKRGHTVKGFYMDIIYESVTPECLARPDAATCEADSTCQWHPSDSTCVGNLLTPENIQAMHEIERTIYQFSYNREESVYLPGMRSLLKFFYAPDGKYLTTDNQFALLTPDQIASFLEYAGSPPEAAQPGFPIPIGPRIYSFFGSSFSATHPRSNFLTTKITIYEEQTDETRAAYYDLLDSVSRPGLDVLYTTPGYVDKVLQEMIAHDVVLCAYALGFVGTCMLIHTASPFLTLMAVFNIAFSFPLALIIYRNICGQTQALPLLAVGSAFVVIGIAVDDIFVFVDMFKQSTSVDMTGRVAHTVQTAVKATLFTSITSATSFASNALSKIPAVHDFGLLSSILVIANYIMVSTLMLSALVVWQKYIRKFEARMLSCLPVCLQPVIDEGQNGYGAGGVNADNVAEYELPDDEDGIAAGGGGGGIDGMRMANPVFQFQNDDMLLVDEPDATGAVAGGGAAAAAAAKAAVPAAPKATMAEVSGANKAVGTKAVTYSWFQRFIATLLTPITGQRGRKAVIIALLIWILITGLTAPKIQADSTLPKFAATGSNLERIESLSQEYADFSTNGGSWNLPETNNAPPPSGGPPPTAPPPGPRPPLTPAPVPTPPPAPYVPTEAPIATTKTATSTTTTFTTIPGVLTTTKTRTTITTLTTTTSTRLNCCLLKDGFVDYVFTVCVCRACPTDAGSCINQAKYDDTTTNDCLNKCFFDKITETTKTATTVTRTTDPNVVTTETRAGKTNAFTTTPSTTSTTNTLYTGAPTRPQGSDCDVIVNKEQCQLQGDCKFVPAGGAFGNIDKCVDINATPSTRPTTVPTRLPQTFGPDRTTPDPGLATCINARSKGMCDGMPHCFYDKIYKVCLNALSTTTSTTAQSNVVTQTLPVPKNEPGAQASTQEASTIPNMQGTLFFGMADPWSLQRPVDLAAAASSDEEEDQEYDLSGAGNGVQMEDVVVYDETFNVPDPSCYNGGANTGSQNCNYQRNGLLPLVAQQLEAFCFDFAASDVVEPGQEGNCYSMQVADLREYLTASRIDMRYAVRDCLPQEARYYTEHVVKWISPKAFTTRVPKNTGFTDVQVQYDAVTAVLDELRAKYPLLKGAGFASGDFKDPLLTNAAVAGASWGIGTSLVLCGIAVALVVMNTASWFIVFMGIILNVASVITIFVWAGWQVGAVEAVSLSILVGTSVDYLLHLVEAYLNAGAPSATELAAMQTLRNAGICGGIKEYWCDVWEALVTGHSLPVDRRILRVVSALTSIGVPIIWSAFTTIGSVLVLTACQIEPLQRFGAILATVSGCSLFITMVVTPALLVVFGPRNVPHSWGRFLTTFAVAAVAVGVLFFVMFIISQAGVVVRGPSGALLFE